MQAPAWLLQVLEGAEHQEPVELLDVDPCIA